MAEAGITDSSTTTGQGELAPPVAPGVWSEPVVPAPDRKSVV